MSSINHWLDEVDLVVPFNITETVVNQSNRTCEDPGLWARLLNQEVNRNGFDTTEEVAVFLAQIGHESADLNHLTESLNYSVSALLQLFDRHRITEEQAEKYGRVGHQKADKPTLANILYGGAWGEENLGNTEWGDGWKYRGGGLIQLTGKHNYEACAADTGLDIVRNPDLLREDEEAALISSLWFWNERVHSKTVKGSTKEINGGYNGLSDRVERYQKALAALQEEF